MPLLRYLAIAIVVAAAPRAGAEPSPDAQPLGTFEISFYWVSVARDFVGPADTVLHDASCAPIAAVPRAFAERVKLEGTGRLRDGRVINAVGACDCDELRMCYAEVDDHWGLGVRNRPLAPFRSIAVDASVIPIGTRLYVPELRGVRMPGRPPWGGFVHDGCVIADDRGGGIRGREVDFFAATRGYYRALQRAYKLRHITLYIDDQRCAEPGTGDFDLM